MAGTSDRKMGDGRSFVSSSAQAGRRGRIVRRYFMIFATLVGGSIVVGVLAEMGLRFEETRRNLEVLHHQMAELAAVRIRDYIEDVAQAVRWTAQPQQVVGGRVADDYVGDLRRL